MRYLLDTHALLWASQNSPHLPAAIAEAIVDPENEIFVSIASLWEIAIKTSLGKLEFHGTIADFQSRIEAMQIVILPISPSNLDTLRSLPFHHKDPFDRLIVATAIDNNLLIVTVDSEIVPYPVKRWWG